MNRLVNRNFLGILLIITLLSPYISYGSNKLTGITPYDYIIKFYEPHIPFSKTGHKSSANELDGILVRLLKSECKGRTQLFEKICSYQSILDHYHEMIRKLSRGESQMFFPENEINPLGLLPAVRSGAWNTKKFDTGTLTGVEFVTELFVSQMKVLNTLNEIKSVFETKWFKGDSTVFTTSTFPTLYAQYSGQSQLLYLLKYYEALNCQYNKSQEFQRNCEARKTFVGASIYLAIQPHLQRLKDLYRSLVNLKPDSNPRRLARFDFVRKLAALLEQPDRAFEPLFKVDIANLFNTYSNAPDVELDATDLIQALLYSNIIYQFSTLVIDEQFMRVNLLDSGWPVGKSSLLPVTVQNQLNIEINTIAGSIEEFLNDEDKIGRGNND